MCACVCVLEESKAEAFFSSADFIDYVLRSSVCTVAASASHYRPSPLSN